MTPPPLSRTRPERRRAGSALHVRMRGNPEQSTHDDRQRVQCAFHESSRADDSSARVGTHPGNAVFRRPYFFTSSASIEILISSPTRNPPVSRTWFQFRPNSPRLSAVLAVKPARSPPQGSFARPSDVTSRTTCFVTPWIVRSPVTLN